MIVEMLINVVYGVFYALTLPIQIPDLPSDVMVYMDSALSYIGMGLGLLSNYCHLNYILTLFGIVIAIDVGLWLYNIVMWILRKIPVLNIS